MPEAPPDNALPDRAPPDAPARIGWWWLGFVGLVGLVGVTVALAVPFSTTTTLMDPVTGATCERKSVVWGGGVDGQVEPTALSRWLADRDLGYEPAWAGVSLRRRNVFGGLVSFRDDPAPAIAALKASLQGWASPLEVFVESASEDRLLGFVQAMMSGGEAERSEAVQAVFEQLR